MSERTGSELLARQLCSEGVEDLFFLPGGPITGVAGFAADFGIRTIDCRHEQAAAMAAHAYARVKNRPGVCLAASGPATTNLLTGIANAYLDGAPLVALGGAAPQTVFDRGGFQEYDQLAMVQAITRWAARVPRAYRMPEYVNLAFRHAMGVKPGPVYLDLPGDALNRSHDESQVWFPSRAEAPARPIPDPEAIRRAIDLLQGARRPIVIGGSGVLWSGGAGALQQFIEATQIPIFTTPSARGVVPEDHEWCFPAARHQAFREADVALVLGTRFNFILGFGQPPLFAADLKVIQIDSDPTEIGRNRTVEIGIVADARRALEALTIAAGGGRLQAPPEWPARLREIDSVRRAPLQAQLESEDRPIHPLRVAHEIAGYIERDAIVAVDGHETLAFARQGIPVYTPGAQLNPGPNGCMGVGVPFALGAKVAAPARQVIAFVGDGSFLMNAQEFDTLVRHNLPVVVVINNNGGWTGGPDDSPGRRLGRGQRYHELVESLGGQGELVTTPAEIRPAIERAFASGRPACVNVHVEEHAVGFRGVFGGYTASMARQRQAAPREDKT